MTKNKNITIDKPKILIGEGEEEKLFFRALLKHLNIDDIQIISYEGKTKLNSFIKTLPNIPGFNNLISLGITRDADNSFGNTLNSINNAIAKSNIPDSIKIEIFILPDHKNKGMLEDLCLQSLTNNPEMFCINQYFKCIKEKTGQQPNNMAKAQVHAWLATQVKLDKRLGEAAQAGYWNWNSEAFFALKKFISLL